MYGRRLYVKDEAAGSHGVSALHQVAVSRGRFPYSALFIPRPLICSQ